MNPSQRWLTISRAGFTVSWLLLMSRISLREVFLDAHPLFSASVEGSTVTVGAMWMLPIITGLTAIAGWRLARRPHRLRWGRPEVTIPMIALSLLILMGSRPIHRPSVLAISIVSVLLLWGFYIYALQNWPPFWAVAAFTVLALVHGSVGLAQFVRQGAVGLQLLGEMAVLDPQVRGVSVIEAGGHRWLRAYGLFAHPNTLGGMMGVSLLICLGALLQEPRWPRWLGAAVVASGVGLFLSFSRSAWLGTGLGLFYLASVTRVWRRIAWRDIRVRRVGVGGLLLLVLVSVIFGGLIRARLWGSDSILERNSVHERLRDLGQAWMLIRQQPLTGVGAGYYKDALWAWADATGQDFPAFQRVHNVPLLLAAEIGVVGAVLWLWLMLAPPLGLLKQVRAGPVQPLRAGWTATFVFLFAVGLFDCIPHVLTFRSVALLGTLWAGWATVRGDLET